ncbi:hypothetical protein Tco_0569232 [Tanacetum coccineum]
MEDRWFKVAKLDRPQIYWSMGSLEYGTTKLCAIWKSWVTVKVHSADIKLARENLQSRVKEEDSITDVENAIFDLGVMDSLCFLLVN